MTELLYLVRLILDRRALLRVGARHRLGQATDEGALIHAGLSQLFARTTERVTVPLHCFAIDDVRAVSQHRPDLFFLLAYSCSGHADLTAAMGPARAELLIDCEAREMPTFERDQRLGFRTRACPVVRTRKPGDRVTIADQRGRAKHRELDAFVHATLDVPKETVVDRGDVYARWLKEQMERHGACTLGNIALTEFRRETVRRRRGVGLTRPNAVLEGTLAVGDPMEFRRLIARGVGRHRAFGFGMLLLRPAVH